MNTSSQYQANLETRCCIFTLVALQGFRKLLLFLISGTKKKCFVTENYILYILNVNAFILLTFYVGTNFLTNSCKAETVLNTQFIIIFHSRYLLIPLGANTSARLTKADIIYDPLPLHHTAGGVLGAGQCLVMGCTVVLRKKFSASNYWKEAAAHKCTVSLIFNIQNNEDVRATTI